MIELHTFGDALIRVGNKEVRPSSPMVFALLLYLCAESGRRIPRTKLQELFFAASRDKSAAHSLRQLLYKLRCLGVPLSNDTASVQLPAEQVHFVPPARGTNTAVLAGFEPHVSHAYRQWLDAFSDSMVATARANLLQQLQSARLRGDTAAVHDVATCLLATDPFNEEATLARAEALALTGQKAEALRLLDEYAKEVATVSETLRLPADVLRKRIAERVPHPEAHVPPLLGRHAELAELHARFHRSQAGKALLTLVSGEAGIGKTRLVDAFRMQIALTRAAIVAIQCRAHDLHRPLGPVIDAIPTLMGMRGALAVTPATMAVLQRIVEHSHHRAEGGPAELVAATVLNALDDLVTSVAQETPVVMIVEDAHWLDEVSFTFLRHHLGRPVPLMLLVTSRTHLQTLLRPDTSLHTYALPLQPLSADHARALMHHMLESPNGRSSQVFEDCLALAAGNPLFLCTLGEHLRHGGAAPDARATIEDLLRQRCRSLSSASLLLLRFIAALGPHCTFARLERGLSLGSGALLLAIQELAELKLITRASETITCSHESLSRLIIDDMPAPICMAVMERIALLLEEEGTSSAAPSILWACADCWTRAGHAEKAAVALRKCARFSADIGQPAFAVDALARAQQLAVTPELTRALIEDAIRVGDEAGLSQSIEENIAALRRLSQRSGATNQSTVAVIAEINCRRRAWRAIGGDMPQLLRCVDDSDALPIDRLRAARIYLMAAEEELNQDAADKVHDLVLHELTAVQGTTAWLHYLLTYHGTFGDLRQGMTVASDITNSAARSTHEPYHFLGHVAFVLFRGGDWQRARDTFLMLIRAAEQRESHLTVANHASQLCMMARQIGEEDVADECYARTARALARADYPHSAPHLANGIEGALARRDGEIAQECHAQLLKAYGDCVTPNRERITLGHLYLLRWLLGRPYDDAEVARGEELFTRGAQVCECDALAAGLALARLSKGDRDGAELLLNHYTKHQRREGYLFPRFLSQFLADAGLVLRAGRGAGAGQNA